jgi:plastocyanin
MDQTMFYVLGIALVVVALVVSFIGLRSERFPNGPAMTISLLIFVGLVIGTATFAVLNAQNEQKDRQEKLAREEAKQGATEVPGGGKVPTPDAAELGAASPQLPRGEIQPGGSEGNGETGASGKPKQKPVKGPGGTLSIAADKTQLAFDKKSLVSKPGKITINFTNPAQIPHDIGVKEGNQLLDVSNQITQSKTSITVDLGPGKYTFLCTVPGHAQAGMQGTLSVK